MVTHRRGRKYFETDQYVEQKDVMIVYFSYYKEYKYLAEEENVLYMEGKDHSQFCKRMRVFETTACHFCVPCVLLRIRRGRSFNF